MKTQRLSTTVDGDKSPYYILATSPQADVHTRVLKSGDTFAVFDHSGNITPTGLGEEGIYHEGTRYLSCLLLGLNGSGPLFLSSTVKADNDLLAVDLTNPDAFVDGKTAIPRGTLHLFRSKFLWNGVCYERLRIKNYGLTAATAVVSFHFEADFADIFEVRGSKRKKKGQHLEPVVEDHAVILGYQGLDGVVRRTRLEFAPGPAAISQAEARFDVSLSPKSEKTIYLTTSFERGRNRPYVASHEEAERAAEHTLRDIQSQKPVVATSNDQFNAWVNRATADLHMMTTHMAEGPYPYAGVPWFSTPFGRDGLLTALECLWLEPALARGVLAYLAATQADDVIPLQDAEPGKILHETRNGEMAALGEIPFGRYYGSVDATLLFVAVAGAYYERTADLPFIQSIWPNVERALGWMETYGDRDGDGFIEYMRTSPQGLVQQGWKDSHDSIFHADGTLVQGPIALCEVQGYAYAAKRAAAVLAAALGNAEMAARLQNQARELQERFERAFWCDDLSTYALALDGDKRPCRVRSSNPGHCLMAGIADPERARRTAGTLLNASSFSGWGVRTLADTEVRYNPMSYHNGSVWPHDNALIACGFARYRFKPEVLQVLQGMFDASTFVDLHRLPELFCGFRRRPGEGPTLYPVACAPQAWAAAAVFMLLQACLGLEVKAIQRQLCFNYPLLPEALPDVRIHNLRIGEASVDLQLVRHKNNVGINVLRREGQVEILMVK
jgi:glycogen debranching enzyme